MYFLNPDGSEMASYQTQGPVMSSPHVMEDGTVVVGSADGYIYFFYPDGHLKASYKTEYIDDTGRKRLGTMMASPTSYKKNGQEYAVMGTGGGDDKVYSFRVTDEVKKWFVAVSGGQVGSELAADEVGHFDEVLGGAVAARPTLRRLDERVDGLPGPEERRCCPLPGQPIAPGSCRVCQRTVTSNFLSHKTPVPCFTSLPNSTSLT